MKTVFALVVLTIILTAAPSFAQGEFLRPGERGFGASGATLLGEDYYAFGLTVVTSPRDNLDLALSYSYDEHHHSHTSHTFGPSLTIYFKSSQPERMLGIGFTAGWARSESKIIPFSVEANFLLFGIRLFGNFYTSPTLAIQPSISGSLSLRLEDVSDRTSTAITPALTLIVGHQAKLRLLIGSGYTIGEDTGESYFSLNAGIVAAW